MGFLALPVVGLERALHAWPPLRPRPEGGGRAVVEREPANSSGGLPPRLIRCPPCRCSPHGGTFRVRPSTRPRPRRTSPPGHQLLHHRPASQGRGRMTSPTVLHICGRACGQPGSGRDGHRHLGSRRAGDSRPARGGHLEHVVPGGPAARARRRRPRPRRAQHRGLRAHPLQLQRHARGHAEGRDRSRAAGRAARRHRGPGRRTGADGRAPDRRADPRRGRRCVAARRPGRRRRSIPATRSTSSSSVPRTASPTRPRCRSRRRRPRPTTRCSSTDRPGSARPTCCTRSATTCGRCSPRSASATRRPSRS